MAVAASAPGSLELANAARRGGPATAFDLWQAADRESHGIRQSRVERYRHAMIHAGFLVTAKGTPFKRCPMCHDQLG